MTKVLQQAIGPDFALYQGDCVEVVKGIPDSSVHYSIFSPPFASLYVYSDSERDMGNCKTHSEFYEHFKFLASDLLRVTIPGRLLSFHCMNLPTSKARDGVIGLTDFRGDLIRIFADAGWIYHSEVCIWKDPVTAMQRTKALGLLHKQIKKDSCMSRQGIADYLVTMRKPGDNPERVTHTDETFPVSMWQRYASPVWMDIDPSDTMNVRSAREHDDERHICPLQLGVIRRGLELWTNPGDRVLSPFAGIGSEGVVSLEMGRRFVGVELKGSYFEQARANLQGAAKQGDLFGATHAAGGHAADLSQIATAERGGDGECQLVASVESREAEGADNAADARGFLASAARPAGGLSASPAKSALTNEGSDDGPDNHHDRGGADRERPDVGVHSVHGLPPTAVPAQPVHGRRVSVQRAAGDQSRTRPDVRVHVQDLRPGADGRDAQDVHSEPGGAERVAKAPAQKRAAVAPRRLDIRLLDADGTERPWEEVAGG